MTVDEKLQITDSDMFLMQTMLTNDFLSFSHIRSTLWIKTLLLKHMRLKNTFNEITFVLIVYITISIRI